MKIRRFYGKDMREALKKVKDELGGEAVIMSNKKHADGIEIIAAYDKEPDEQLLPKKDQLKVQANLSRPPPTLSEIIGDSGPDSLKALLEKQSQSASTSIPKEVRPVSVVQPQVYSDSAISASSHAHYSSQPNNQQNNQQQDALKEMRQELSSLRHILQFQVSGLIEQEKNRKHPLHGYLLQRLQQMGISDNLAEEVLSYAPESADERQSWLFLLKLLANRLQTKHDDILSQPGVVALMGPTGVGKTTTIAKLAAQAAHKFGVDQVAIITLDNYRIGAYEQIATYGKIIGCSVKQAQNSNELSDLLHQFRNKRLVLVDTAGFSQKDARLIKQLDTMKQNTRVNIRHYLVMQANCQYRVMQQTVNEYRQISLQGCILTKLDECYSLGEVISVAIENKLQICYLADGQRVPEDLQSASTKFLITSAAKLYKKFGLIHNRANDINNAAVAV
ncbi:flagellar biosynthesis protein FlhF [Paraglaciecola psychrophila]|uniref:Flagellar biosynthesis protein FlhF n=1 Tax=Paraglaciecola psychrophila 170 TaxID=1129794 RepID=K7ASR2_9ALTE|nr:flagellar biosynthesis protein FlhF [Paraglaciecola psychrophila]AGH45762.1 flagellar biosynthetic protein FlhF [Paraglaciecola psychrophila 170]GAC38280.1 flagellar biosynthesis protein FlhF [Paraglaciecola psychrophila 170]